MFVPLSLSIGSASIRPPMAAVELPQVKNRPPTATNSEMVDYESLLHFSQPIAGDLNLEEFVSLSFTHHMEILNKTKTLDERLFYIHEAVVNKWDKYLLRDMLKGNNLYKHQGEMPNNFAKTMPNTQSALWASPRIRQWKMYTVYYLQKKNYVG